MKTTKQTRRIELETLEARAVPAAYISSGWLYVVGSNSANDVATVAPTTINGVSYLQVSDNGQVSNHLASSAYNGIAFYGYGGNDYFRNTSAKAVYADGGSGDDVLIGGTGADRLMGRDGNDRMWGGGGNDSIWGEAGSDLLVGDGGDDSLMGGDGTDELWGGDGNDSLWGEGGLDFLLGGAGNDYLDGGTDGGIAWGGSGADRFYNLPGPTGYYFTDFMAPYTSTVRGLPGTQDFSAAEGDTHDAVSF